MKKQMGLVLDWNLASYFGKSKMRHFLVAILVGFLCVAPTSASASGFSDSFEGTTLNPFWSVKMYGGVNNLADYSFSTEQARSGAQSLKISFGANGIPGMYLEHLFGSPVKGTFSVWYYDTLDPVHSGLYVDDYTTWASLGVSYYDFYNPDWGYYTSLPTVKVGNQSLGWHHYEIIISDTGSSYRLDGVDLGLMGPLTNVNRLLIAGQIDLNVSNTGNYVAYFDDFSFTDAAVPEPTTMLLLGSGLIGLAGYGRKKFFNK